VFGDGGALWCVAGLGVAGLGFPDVLAGLLFQGGDLSRKLFPLGARHVGDLPAPKVHGEGIGAQPVRVLDYAVVHQRMVKSPLLGDLFHFSVEIDHPGGFPVVQRANFRGDRSAVIPDRSLADEVGGASGLA
jgi:hypothetical protein